MRALITGAAHGLGRALTENLLDNGHEVFAVDVDTAPLDALAISSRGACTVKSADMARRASIERFVAGLGTTQFDLVILNAGINATGKFEKIPADAHERVIAINATAPMIIAAALVRQGNVGKAHTGVKRGKIVFISSLSHAVGYPGASVYAATKSALAVYARAVRKPFRSQGAKVLAVFPGPIRTAHAKKYAPPGSMEKKRMEPQKMAAMILKAAEGKTKEFYPGMAAGFAKTFGNLAPWLTTRMMRRAIFDKLREPTV